MFVVRSSVFVVCCSFAGVFFVVVRVCCSSCVARCLLFVTCWLFVVGFEGYSLAVSGCLSLFVDCWLLLVVCSLLPIVRCVMCVDCWLLLWCLLFVVCFVAVVCWLLLLVVD